MNWLSNFRNGKKNIVSTETMGEEAGRIRYDR